MIIQLKERIGTMKYSSPRIRAVEEPFMEPEIDGMEEAVNSALETMGNESPSTPPAESPPPPADQPAALKEDILAHTIEVNQRFLARLEADVTRLRTTHTSIETDLTRQLEQHRADAALREKEITDLIAQNKKVMEAKLDERQLLIRGTTRMLETITLVK